MNGAHSVLTTKEGAPHQDPRVNYIPIGGASLLLTFSIHFGASALVAGTIVPGCCWVNVLNAALKLQFKKAFIRSLRAFLVQNGANASCIAASCVDNEYL